MQERTLAEKNKLIEDNISLVVWVIDTYYNHCSFQEREELFQVGCMGLVNAANYWDGISSKFTTYASKSILVAIVDEQKKENRRTKHIAFSLDMIRDESRSYHEIFGTDEINDDVLFDDFDDSEFRAWFNDKQRELYEWLIAGKEMSEFVATHTDTSYQAIYQRLQLMRRKWIRLYGSVYGFDNEGKPRKKGKEK